MIPNQIGAVAAHRPVTILGQNFGEDNRDDPRANVARLTDTAIVALTDTAIVALTDTAIVALTHGHRGPKHTASPSTGIYLNGSDTSVRGRLARLGQGARNVSRAHPWLQEWLGGS